MKPKEIEKLIKALKSGGVSYFKNSDLEVRFTSDPVEEKPKRRSVPRGTKEIPLQAIPPVEAEIPHHENEVLGLLKLSDEELVDKMFPDFTQGQGQ